MINQICDVMMSISTWDRVYFWIYPLNHNTLSHQTWPIDTYKQGPWFSGIIWIIWRTGSKLQVLLNLGTCSTYSITNYVKIPVFHIFAKVNKWINENGKCQLLKMATSCHTVILVKGLVLVSSFQHWAKNMLEMFVIQQTIIWQNFILIVLRIQKK